MAIFVHHIFNLVDNCNPFYTWACCARKEGRQFFLKIGGVVMVLKYNYEIATAKCSVNNKTIVNENIMSISLL